MAKIGTPNIYGFELKKIERTRGMEGYGLCGEMYLNGKKIGTYEDYGDGGMGNERYDTKEDRIAMTHLIFKYGDKYPSQFMLDLFKEEPNRIEEEKERIRKYQPFITEEEMTLNALSNNDLDTLVYHWEQLNEEKKAFNRAIKKGYAGIATCKGDDESRVDNEVTYLIPKRILDDINSGKTTEFDGKKIVRVISSLEDLNIKDEPSKEKEKEGEIER